MKPEPPIRNQLVAAEAAISHQLDLLRNPSVASVGIRGGPPDNPDLAHVSTSYVERHNLSIRMGNRRFTRLTNAFSKKIDNHVHALALFFMHYNFVRQHKSLNKSSPAMAAGISETLWSMEDIAEKIEERRPAPKVRGPYKKRVAA
jgi:hypothetical protein